MQLDHGGKQRSYNLARALSEKHEVVILALSWKNENFETQVDDNFKVVSVAVDPVVLRLAKSFGKRLIHQSTDLMLSKFAKNITNYHAAMNELAQDSDLVIVDHAAMATFLPHLTKHRGNIFYLGHNSELNLARQLYPLNSLDMNLTRKIEEMVFDKSNAFAYCSNEDLMNINNDFSPSIPGYYIPNGTDMKENIIPGANYDSKNILYVGSAHPPNNVAAKNIVKIAAKTPSYNFIVCGNAANAINDNHGLPNLVKKGYVSSEELDSLYRSAFAFINPIEQGSGTHLKMTEALSYALPIITSAVGARGFNELSQMRDMLVGSTTQDFVDAINKLTDKNIYTEFSKNAYELSKEYSWDKIKKDYLEAVEATMGEVKNIQVNNVLTKKSVNKESVLIYSIIRNEAKFFDRYHSQLQKIVQTFPNYDFYLSIYENDSNDGTKQKIFTKDWSFFKGVSIISENINTRDYGPTKDADRVMNLSIARNKAIEANDMLNKVDYIMMIESDFRFNMNTVQQILNFKTLEPDFDIVSAISIRNGNLYDAWATRKDPVFVKGVPVLSPNYKQKPYDKYYSTSNGICLYRAKPFQEGVRYGWINTVTGEADCDTVVVCQNFIEKGYDNIYILHNAEAYHEHR